MNYATTKMTQKVQDTKTILHWVYGFSRFPEFYKIFRIEDNYCLVAIKNLSSADFSN